MTALTDAQRRLRAGRGHQGVLHRLLRRAERGPDPGRGSGMRRFGEERVEETLLESGAPVRPGSRKDSPEAGHGRTHDRASGARSITRARAARALGADPRDWTTR